MDNIYIYTMKFGENGGIVEHISSEYYMREGRLWAQWKTENGRITRSVLPGKPKDITDDYRVWFTRPNKEGARSLFLDLIHEKRNKILEELDKNSERIKEIERG